MRRLQRHALGRAVHGHADAQSGRLAAESELGLLSGPDAIAAEHDLDDTKFHAADEKNSARGGVSRAPLHALENAARSRAVNAEPTASDSRPRAAAEVGKRSAGTPQAHNGAREARQQRPAEPHKPGARQQEPPPPRRSHAEAGQTHASARQRSLAAHEMARQQEREEEQTLQAELDASRKAHALKLERQRAAAARELEQQVQAQREALNEACASHARVLERQQADAARELEVARQEDRQALEAQLEDAAAELERARQKERDELRAKLQALRSTSEQRLREETAALCDASKKELEKARQVRGTLVRAAAITCMTWIRSPAG